MLDDCLKQFDEYAVEFIKSVQFSSDPAKDAELIVNGARNEATKLETDVCH